MACRECSSEIKTSVLCASFSQLSCSMFGYLSVSCFVSAGNVTEAPMHGLVLMPVWEGRGEDSSKSRQRMERSRSVVNLGILGQKGVECGWALLESHLTGIC